MRESVRAAARLALFIGALLASHRQSGSSPIAWVDTFRDEEEVQRCVVSDSCTLTGMEASVPGQVAAVAWLELRTLLAWLGVGLDGAHLLMQLFNAFAVVLVFHLATQLGGRLAGVAAVWILVFGIGAQAIRLTGLYNQQWLLFLGAVLALACTAVVERPGMVSVALAALVGAVMANVHLACVLAGVSVVWVALLAPRRRLLLAAFGATLFALASFVVAPPSWLHNLASLLQRREAGGGASGVITLPHSDLVRWALLAMGAWVVSLASRAPVWVEYRRRSQGALAVIVPLLAAFLVAPHFGVEANVRYLVHLKAACAIAAALPLGLVASTMLGTVVPQRLLRVVEGILVFAMALLVAVGLSTTPTADDERTATTGDLVAVAHILHDERGWDIRRMLENVKAPDSMTALTGLSQLSTAGDGQVAGVVDVGTSAVLLVVEADELPQPLPSSWRIVRRAARAATVLVFMQSRLDWRTFQVCVRQAGGAEPRCEAGGWRFDEAAGVFRAHVPVPSPRTPGTLTLQVPLRPAEPGRTDEIFMPRMQGVCGGDIVALSGRALRVDPDRRHATLLAPAPGQAGPSVIELEWHIGSRECDAWAYDGLPFVVEGDAATVQRVEALLRKREG